jgi:hypothetical protein
MNMRKGAAGETLVSLTLESFPAEFYVINDLTTPFGNLDHIVIGPTGVFILDTKNVRGVVTADGAGGVLLNGRTADGLSVKKLVGRAMSIRDRLRPLAPGTEPYFQCVFVFTSAKVEAQWGTTGKVHCLDEEKLYDYIVESKCGKNVKAQEVKIIAQAFLALARMDKDFTAHAISPSLTISQTATI